MEPNERTEFVLAALNAPEVQERIREIIGASIIRNVQGQSPAQPVPELSGDSEYDRLKDAFERLSRDYEILAAKREEERSAFRIQSEEDRRNYNSHLKIAMAGHDVTKSALAKTQTALKDTSEDLESARQSIRRMEGEALRLGASIKDLTQQLAPFAELRERYQAFLKLPESCKTDLHSIVFATSPTAFLVSGCQRDTIFSLWDYLKLRLGQLSDTETKILVQTLLYFMKQYNSLWKQPLYEWMDSETGELFNNDRHSRSSDCSRLQGFIEKVLLPGIWNRSKNYAERKCIVYYSNK